jgi:DNA-binding SARP family transcriptional activator
LLRLHLLGGFRAVRESGPPPAEKWTRPGARALVKMLAVAPDHQLHREEAIATCWPEADLESGIGRLRVALHAARRALEPELASRTPSSYLITDGALLRLDPTTVWVDIDHAEHLATTALQQGGSEQLSNALAAFTGELLPEDRYALWAEARRGQLAGLRERLRLALAEALLRDGLADEAAEVAREVLADNPAEERAHQAVMRAYLQLDLRRQAIRQYHSCREILDADLGIRPGPETERLHLLALQVIGGGSANTAAVEIAPPPQLRVPPPSPLRGRREALAALLAEDGRPVQLIGGEAGLGKTRLVTEAARRRLDSGAVVLWGAVYDAEGHAPYSAFVDALDGWLADRPAADRARVGAEYPELAGLLPSLGQTGADVERSPEEERQRLFGATAGLLKDLTAAAPLLVVLDDMQGADLGSFQLLSHLARRSSATGGRDWRFAIVYRGEDLPETDPRRVVLDSLVRDDLAAPLELRRLGRLDCEAVAADLIGISPEQVPKQVWDLSLGNPLFAQELARGLEENDADPRPPQGVRQLVAARLARLEPSARRIVEVAAVAGGDAAISEVLDVAAAEGLHPKLSASEAAEAADLAVNGAVLAERDVVVDGRRLPGLAFQHPLVRMTCYEQMSAAKRQVLHTAYADTVLRRRPDAVDTLAAHLLRADDPRATAYLRQAAERAAALCANDTADHYYAELTRRLDAVAAEAAWARIDRSAVLQRMGRSEDAARVLREALDDLKRRGDTDGLVLASGRLAEAVARSGEPDTAMALLDGQPPTMDTSALAATVHHVSRALVLLFLGRYAEGVEAAKRARVFAERVSGPERRGLLARALQFQAASLALDGRFAEAGPVADEALPHAEAFGDPRMLASVLSVQREQARRSGRLREALETGRRALELAERSGDPEGVAFEQANLAELHLLLDECTEAETLATAAVKASGTHPDRSTPYAMVALARVRMRTSSAQPHDLLAGALRAAETRTDRQAEHEALLALAEWQLRQGRPDESLAMLAEVTGGRSAVIRCWAHVEAGQPEIAADSAKAEISRAEQAGERLTEVEARIVYAAALAALGLDEEAVREFAAATSLATALPYPEGLQMIERAKARSRGDREPSL